MPWNPFSHGSKDTGEDQSIGNEVGSSGRKKKRPSYLQEFDTIVSLVKYIKKP